MGSSNSFSGLTDAIRADIDKAFTAGLQRAMPAIFPNIFKVESSAKSQENHLAMAGLGDWAQLDDLEPGGADYLAEVGVLSFVHETYKKSLIIPRKSFDDDQSGQIQRNISMMGYRAIMTAERRAARVFNDGFTVSNGIDGKPLFDDAHILKKSASTGDNKATTSLTADNFAAAMTMIKTQKDENNLEILVNPTILLVPPALESAARIITQSQLKPGTANNDINIYQGALNVIVNPFLSSATAWFLIDKELAELWFYWRVKPETAQAVGPDLASIKVAGYARMCAGFADWRGVWGSTG